MEDYPIEIDWNDVVAKLSKDLVAAQRDSAMRYAMCEALKRKLNEKAAPDPGSQQPE
jgi:hypothetical protein